MSDKDITGIEVRHDELFGKGSWAELVKGVHERHPYLKQMLENSLTGKPYDR